MAYNLTTKGEKVKIGNWLEESRLKEDTGVRYYPSPKDKKNSLLTQARCITHTDQIHSKDYISLTRQTIIDPKTHPEYRPKVQLLGPRAAILEAKLSAEINNEFKQKESSELADTRKTTVLSETRASYQVNAFKSKLNENDHTIRLPTKSSNYSVDNAITYYSYTLSKGKDFLSFPTTFVGSIVNPFKKSSAFSSNIQTELVTNRTETNERPMQKLTVTELKVLKNFRDKLIQCVRNHIIDANNNNNNNNVIPYGSAVRAIVNTIQKKINNLNNTKTNSSTINNSNTYLATSNSLSSTTTKKTTDAKFTFSTLEDLLSNSFNNFTITQAEKKVLLIAYTENNIVNYNNNNFNNTNNLKIENSYSENNDNKFEFIDIKSFLNLFRKIPSPRRFEVIDFFYSKLDPSGDGDINYKKAIEPFIIIHNNNSDIIQNLFSFLKAVNIFPEQTSTSSLKNNNNNVEINVDDFFDYFVDVSSEIENDDEFEKLLIDTFFFI
jgi:hypothetical protein